MLAIIVVFILMSVNALLSTDLFQMVSGIPTTARLQGRVVLSCLAELPGDSAFSLRPSDHPPP